MNTMLKKATVTLLGLAALALVPLSVQAHGYHHKHHHHGPKHVHVVVYPTPPKKVVVVRPHRHHHYVRPGRLFAHAVADAVWWNAVN